MAGSTGLFGFVSFSRGEGFWAVLKIFRRRFAHPGRDAIVLEECGDGKLQRVRPAGQGRDGHTLLAGQHIAQGGLSDAESKGEFLDRAIAGLLDAKADARP